MEAGALPWGLRGLFGRSGNITERILVAGHSHSKRRYIQHIQTRPLRVIYDQEDPSPPLQSFMSSGPTFRPEAPRESEGK